MFLTCRVAPFLPPFLRDTGEERVQPTRRHNRGSPLPPLPMRKRLETHWRIERSRHQEIRFSPAEPRERHATQPIAEPVLVREATRLRTQGRGAVHGYDAQAELWPSRWPPSSRTDWVLQRRVRDLRRIPGCAVQGSAAQAPVAQPLGTGGLHADRVLPVPWSKSVEPFPVQCRDKPVVDRLKARIKLPRSRTGLQQEEGWPCRQDGPSKPSEGQ